MQAPKPPVFHYFGHCTEAGHGMLNGRFPTDGSPTGVLAAGGNDLPSLWMGVQRFPAGRLGDPGIEVTGNADHFPPFNSSIISSTSA